MDCAGCLVNPLNITSKVGDSEEKFVLYLQNHGVLRREMLCPKCGQKCKLTSRPLIFRCQRSQRNVDKVKIKCNYSHSLKTNSFLEHVNAHYEKMIKFISVWLTVPHPRHDFLQQTLEMSHRTVVEWSLACREICINSVVLSELDILGGPEMIVELDEVKYGQNNMGRDTEDSWILGAFERETKRFFFEILQDCSGVSLMAVILRRIAPGTTIVSGLWGGYNQLLNHQQYEHLKDHHKVKFVDPINGHDTLNVKIKWKKLLSHIRTYGRNNGSFDQGYIAEYYWKTKHPINERMHQFLLEVARQYDPTAKM